MTACTMEKMRLSALADGELSESEAWAVERHAAECAECAADLKALRALRAGVAAMDAAAVSPAEWRRVWTGVRQALPARSRAVTWAERLARLWAVPRPALAMAALLLAAVTATLLHRAGSTPAGGEDGFLVAQENEVRLVSVSDQGDYSVRPRKLQGGGSMLWVSRCGVAKPGEVRLESVAYNSDAYRFSMKEQDSGDAPVLWFEPSRAQ